MKKVFSILAIAAMFAFASCGDKADNSGDDAADQAHADSILAQEEQEMPVVDTTAAATADTTANTDAENAEGGDAEGDHTEGDH